MMALFAKGADPNALVNMHFGVVYANRSRPFAPNWLPQTAAGSGPDSVSELPDPETPLVDAIAFDSTELVRILLDHGANPKSRSNEYGTPLQQARQYDDNPDIVELLKAHGAKE